MSDLKTSKEQRVLRMVKRVLTDIAKDTHAPAGVKHSLSELTIQGMRECLALITAREAELAEEAGHTQSDRPHFVDEPKKSHVVQIQSIQRKKSPPESGGPKD